jgi:hypothetical protein
MVAKLGVGRGGAENPIDGDGAQVGEQPRAAAIAERGEHQVADLLFLIGWPGQAVAAEDWATGRIRRMRHRAVREVAGTLLG